jgi:hypothetical protein
MEGFLRTKNGIFKANGLAAHHFTRCIGHLRGHDEEGSFDGCPGHGKNFQACATALHLRTTSDLDFGVRWATREQNLQELRHRRE